MFYTPKYVIWTPLSIDLQKKNSMARPNTPTQFLKIYIFQHRIIDQITLYPIILRVRKCYLFIAIIVYWIRLPWAQHNYVEYKSTAKKMLFAFHFIYEYGIMEF